MDYRSPLLVKFLNGAQACSHAVVLQPYPSSIRTLPDGSKRQRRLWGTVAHLIGVMACDGRAIAYLEYGLGNFGNMSRICLLLFVEPVLWLVVKAISNIRFSHPRSQDADEMEFPSKVSYSVE